MAVVTRRPTLEPTQMALLGALQAGMTSACTQIAAAYGDGIPLPAPRNPVPDTHPADNGGYTVALLRRYALIQEWPTIAVVTGNIRATEAGEYTSWMSLDGDLGVEVFMQNDDGDELSLQLERYVEAIFAVLSANDMPAGNPIEWDKFSVEVDTTGVSVNQRGVRINLTVKLGAN